MLIFTMQFITNNLHIQPIFTSDENECALSPCSGHSVCVNTPGSFTCRCDNGYYLTDPLTCTGIVYSSSVM